MKQNIFSKKNQLDEMQEQTLRKIESHGFWLMWWGLFAVIIFQLMMQADISQVAGAVSYTHLTLPTIYSV